MDRTTLIRALEAVLFVSSEPIPMNRLTQLFEEEGVDPAEVKDAVAALKRDFMGRGVELKEIGGGLQFRTSDEVASFIARLEMPRPARLSQAAMETLAIVAYRQPVTRADAEEVRGVDCGAVMRTLHEKGLVKIVGKKDVPGRPMLYGTTKKFLELFGLSSLTDLPTLKEIEELVAPAEDGEEGEEELDLAGNLPVQQRLPETPNRPLELPELPLDEDG